ncbi:MAG: YicC/YloC family endoribonuclease [Nitrospinales bacterium]
MLKSMTGYGRSEKHNGDYSFVAEIRSVNNRFIDVNVRIPKFLNRLEHEIKKLVKSKCSRGSFDLTLNLERTNGSSATQEIKANLPQAEQYLKAFNDIKNEFGLSGEVEISSLLSLRDIIKTESPEFDSSQEEIILAVVEVSLDELIKMRELEGQNLKTDILNQIEGISQLAQSIQARSPLVIKEAHKKLREKIQAFNDGVDLDENRLAQEAAILADRSDFSEEIIRLESHLQQFKALAETDDPIGRKLEFITQEINREANTIGSKSTDLQVTQSVIEIKSRAEKIREQIQNIE